MKKNDMLKQMRVKLKEKGIMLRINNMRGDDITLKQDNKTLRTTKTCTMDKHVIRLHFSPGVLQGKEELVMETIQCFRQLTPGAVWMTIESDGDLTKYGFIFLGDVWLNTFSLDLEKQKDLIYAMTKPFQIHCDQNVTSQFKYTGGYDGLLLRVEYCIGGHKGILAMLASEDKKLVDLMDNGTKISESIHRDDISTTVTEFINKTEKKVRLKSLFKPTMYHVESFFEQGRPRLPNIRVETLYEQLKLHMTPVEIETEFAQLAKGVKNGAQISSRNVHLLDLGKAVVLLNGREIHCFSEKNKEQAKKGFEQCLIEQILGAEKTKKLEDMFGA